MKKMHIALLILSALSLAVILAMVSDGDTIKTFAEAQEMPEGKLSTIVGELHQPETIQYNEKLNPNLTTFFMKDSRGDVMKVKYFEPKPMDFEKSEEVRVTGEVVNDEFHAKELLVKCPSKYNEAGVKEATAQIN